MIATKLGESIYKSIGFRTELNYEFYKQSDSFKNLELLRNIRVASKADFEEIIELDFAVTREKRDKLIEMFLSVVQLIFNLNGRLKGFFIENLGNGLIITNDFNYGLELLKVKMNKNGQSVVIPETNLIAKDYLIKNGYKNYMTVPRMILGKKYKWKSEHIFSRGSGYSG